MIARLTGRVARRSPGEIVLDVGGVGYAVSIPLSTFCALPSDADTISLEIHTHVRDDAIQLFGFWTPVEKLLFLELLSVSGVGPRIALAVLSGFPARDAARAIVSGDAAALRSVPGVGRKLAERIVLELKERVEKLALASSGPLEGSAMRGDDAESALENLGYAPAEARKAIEQVRRSNQGPVPLETLLREALRILAR